MGLTASMITIRCGPVRRAGCRANLSHRGLRVVMAQLVSNFMFNHIGHFAASAEGLCRSLLMGGITRRFPDLKFAFVEGGVGWARSLLSDSIGHWEKRTAEALENYDPAKLDREMLLDLSERFESALRAWKERIFDGHP